MHVTFAAASIKDLQFTRQRGTRQTLQSSFTLPCEAMHSGDSKLEMVEARFWNNTKKEPAKNRKDSAFNLRNENKYYRTRQKGALQWPT
jgi:hypothetical protein